MTKDADTPEPVADETTVPIPRETCADLVFGYARQVVTVANEERARMCGPGCGAVVGRQKHPMYCSEACCDAGGPLNPPPARRPVVDDGEREPDGRKRLDLDDEPEEDEEARDRREFFENREPPDGRQREGCWG